MSCYEVSHDNIRALAAFIASNRDARKHVQRIVFNDNDMYIEEDVFACRVFAELVNCNRESVGTRYNEAFDLVKPNDIDAHGMSLVTLHECTHLPVTNPVYILSMCDNLEYQSCDYSGWDDSKGKKLLDNIRNCAIQKLDGYTWGFDAPERDCHQNKVVSLSSMMK